MFEFLQKRARRFIVVDCNPSMTKIVYIERVLGSFKLLAYEIRRTNTAPKDAAGAVIDFVNEFRAKNSISAQDVVMSVSDPTRVAIKHITLPILPDSEVTSAAKWQLKEEVSFDLTGSIIDWQTVKESADASGVRKKEILCMAAPKETVDGCLFMVSQCRLNPVSIVSGPANYAALLHHIPGNPSVSAVVDIDYSDSTIGIYLNNNLYFVRRLPVSWKKLTQSLTEILVSDAGKIQLSYDEAEEIKNTFGIPETETTVVRDHIRAGHIMSLVRPFLETLVREIKFSFDHFSSHFDAAAPAALYITGGGASLKNLTQYLQKELGLKTLYLPLPACVHTDTLKEKALGPHEQNILMSAIGAALSDPGAINLLPPEIREQKALSLRKSFLRLVAITVGWIFLFLLFIAKFQEYDYTNRLKNARRHLQTLGQITALKQNIRLREDLLGKIQRNRVPLDGMLKVLGNATAPEIILDELVFDHSRQGVTLKGTVSARGGITEPMLADFMRRLEESVFFTEATFVSSQRTVGSERFVINGELAP